MRRLLYSAGVLIALCMPGALHAQNVFDLFYGEAERALPTARPDTQLAEYVIREMESWEGRGIQLEISDIDAALAYRLSELCAGKTDMEGEAYEFAAGGPGVAGSCAALWEDITTLIATEQEVQELGADLLTIANGAELTVANEPHRPMDMAAIASTLRRVWSGTGSSFIPWNSDADADLRELENHLTDENVELAVERFHHGYFRDARENDPRFTEPPSDAKTSVQDQVREDLRRIAEKLGVTGNPRDIGIFVTPGLSRQNVALWARKDDIGLQWVYPTRPYAVNLGPADQYPEFHRSGESLAYPFAYEGSASPDSPSPLCSRTVGRQGYLCRALPPLAENCSDPGSGDSISLVKCSQRIVTTPSGPTVCPDFDRLFADTGLPLVDPADPGRLNPALEQADTSHICTPDTRVLYQDDITSHACYVGHCLLESMSGHTLVPNRSPVVLNEATSPYLACIRPDPQLGLYTEIAEDTPYPLPEYLGQFLIRDFDRQYCVTNGNAPHSLAGLCSYRDDESATAPLYSSIFHAINAREQGAALAARQEDMLTIAAAYGYRASLDQSVELHRKIFARLAHVVQHTADLLLSLKDAPLTQTACPWTGPFTSTLPPE